MNILAESTNYQILNEYESVFLKCSTNKKLICIGDFYGNPEVAVISKSEKLCVIGGCGVIIYYLKEPFEEYKYNMQTEQWKEWGRPSEGDDIWINNIRFIDDQYIEIETEDGEIVKLDV